MTVTSIDRITEFKIAAYDKFPYLAPYVYSLTPVERPGLGTMAVDKYGRLYYDPVFAESLTLEQGAYVIYHEATHLILRHCHRAPGIIGDQSTGRERYLLNVAMDAVVWEFLEAIKDDCPKDGVTFDKLKADYPQAERNLTVEQWYAILAEKRKHPEPEKEESEDDEKDTEQKEDGPSEQEGGDEKADEDSDGEDSDNPIRGDGFGGSEKRPGDGGGDPQDNSGGDSQDQEYEMIGGGSAADGLDRDYEEEPDPKWDAFVEDRLLEAVEKKIEELENDEEWRRSRGTIPGELKQVIKRKLHPKVNPWDRLRATVSKAAANPKGFPDYTYRRPNRRQQGNDIRLKGISKYAPKAAVVVDTSGSMSSGCLAKALGVIKQGLRALGQVPVITCDSRIGMDQTLTAVHEDFEFVGGGGTDMRIPLAYAEEKYKPDVVVIVTDTYTPWPNKKMKAQLIVAATQDGDVPNWAIKVRIPDSHTKEELDD